MPRHPSITGKPRPAVTLSVSLQLERLCQTRPCAGQPGQMTGAQERLGVLAGPAQGCGGHSIEVHCWHLQGQPAMPAVARSAPSWRS